MNPKDILKEYERLVAAQSSSDSEFSSVVLLEQDRIRMVLTKCGGTIRLDVEITGPSLETTSDTSDAAMTQECKRAILGSIELLEYILTLVDNGFTLTVIDSEFLWTASFVLIEPPSESLLISLQPPDVGRLSTL
ncbi:MAG: hypothetical protein JSW05_02510 [Candidatus Thorarchaeota archaeon]|nr:MAG: hypothetical protein JSW05_02510 [Candidatus Thorarchaeota archaeon]